MKTDLVYCALFMNELLNFTHKIKIPYTFDFALYIILLHWAVCVPYFRYY